MINRHMTNVGVIVYFWCSFYFNDNCPGGGGGGIPYKKGARRKF